MTSCYCSGLHWTQCAFSHLCQHIFRFKWIPEAFSSRGNGLHLFIAFYPPACQYQRCLSWTKKQRWTFSAGPQPASIKTSQYTLYPRCQGKVEACNFIYRLCAGADGNLLIAQEGSVGTWEVCKAGRLYAGCIKFLSHGEAWKGLRQNRDGFGKRGKGRGIKLGPPAHPPPPQRQGPKGIGLTVVIFLCGPRVCGWAPSRLASFHVWAHSGLIHRHDGPKARWWRRVRSATMINQRLPVIRQTP